MISVAIARFRCIRHFLARSLVRRHLAGWGGGGYRRGRYRMDQGDTVHGGAHGLRLQSMALNLFSARHILKAVSADDI